MVPASQANPGSLIPGICQSNPGMKKRRIKLEKGKGYINTAPYQERDHRIYV